MNMNSLLSLSVRILLCLLLALTAMAAQAQPVSPDADPDQLTGIDAGRLQALIDTLEDPERRAIFLERLNTLQALQQDQPGEQQPGEAEAAPTGLAQTLTSAASDAVDSLHIRLESAVQYFSATPEALSATREALVDPEQRMVILEIISKVAGTLLVALLGASLVARLLSHPRNTLQSRPADNVFSRALLMTLALLLRLMPLAGFLAIAYAAMPLIDPRAVTQTVLVSLVHAHVIAQAVMITAGVALTVDSPAQRPYTMADETAAYLYVWIRRITIVSVYGYFIAQSLLELGMDAGSHSLLVDLTGLVVALLLVILVLQNRQSVAHTIRGGEEVTGLAAQLRGTLGLFWHLLALLYIGGVYMVWVTGVEGGFTFLVWRTVLTLAILLATRIILTGAQRGLKRLFHLPARLRAQYPGLEQRADRYRPVVTRILKVLLMTVAVIGIAQTWGLNAAGIFTTETGRALLARILRILLIVAAGFLVWEIAAALIERKLQATSGNRRRIVTVLPLLKNIVRMTIGAVGVMIVLSELGMNIGPLIASAGVIGLAIGFGAQTLVRDLISGMFVIFEDIVAVGDWVEIGPHTGIVESMHIRTMELRDLSGNIRVIPFGDVTSVHKVANDYSYAMMVIGVAYREDVDEVVSLLSQIGEEMQQDEKWKEIIREPLTVDGVNDMASSSIDIRLRFKCKPLEQWALRREFLRRTKKLFDEKGIEIPFPHQTLYFGQEKDGSAPAANIRLQETARGHDERTDKGDT